MSWQGSVQFPGKYKVQLIAYWLVADLARGPKLEFAESV